MQDFLNAILGQQNAPIGTFGGNTINSKQINSQASRVADMIRQATSQSMPTLGDELRRQPAQDEAFYQNLASISMGAAPSQNIYGAGQTAIDTARKQRAEIAATQLGAEQDVYNLMMKAKEMGDQDAIAIYKTIESVVGNDPVKIRALYEEIDKDPEDVNASNIAIKANKAAADLGLYNTDIASKDVDAKVVGGQVVRINKKTGEVTPIYTAPSTAPINPETGMPERKLTSSEQKELFDTQDLISSANMAKNALIKAKDILINSPEGQEPYTGFAAETRAGAARLPLIGDIVADKERGAATSEYRTLVQEQALNSLKAIFGGMPTEGERQVLMQMQALPEFTPQEQERIINNAIAAAENRINYNKNKANVITTGNYSTGFNDLTPTPSASLSGNAQAQTIKQQYKSGQITKQQAEAALDALSGGQ